ncbi:MAG: calcium/sodium antiporter [Gammaproteobacteria bacterium]|nr:calcium/sodium antiporter [Gammaproteobacteria bacterium]MAY02325.1 calcium/sodium antiporter [Gammaproteobacteria bacterium]|tara:strand:+ start:452435 stop:453406 length:972 start_codon:yes stop_codon:yes gene_type:complete
MDLFVFSLSIIGGIIGLVWSADKFVLGASTTARNLGVSVLVIGLTVVSFGTSAPEILTSGTAALQGKPELAIGNVLGSNITNIGLVLSITALICPIVIPKTLLKEELPALLIITLAAVYIFYDLSIDWTDGIILLVLLAGFTWFILKVKKSSPQAHSLELEEAAEHIADISTGKALGLMLFGLILLLISANVLVYGATGIALALGVSELIIGLTIVAIGTSLPELAASVAGALRGHHDLALGNVVGSNILNLVLVLPVPAFLAPVTIAPVVFWRDTAFMLFMTFVLIVVIALNVKFKQSIGRLVGVVLLLLYISYTGLLVVMR